MERISVDVGVGGKLDYSAQIHDSNSIADMLDNTQVVRDEQICQFMPDLDFLQ
jgi:hypothetical protein